MDCSLPGSSIHRIFQARLLEWVAIAFSEKAAVAAKSLQSCLTLCDPIDSSPPGSPVPGILQARILEWVVFSSSEKAEEVVKKKKKLFHEIIQRFGLPRSLQSDNGTSFTSKVTQGVSKAFSFIQFHSVQFSRSVVSDSLGL